MASENTLASTMTDMMTSLMVIFILLLVNFLREQQGEADKTSTQRQALMEALKTNVILEELEKQGVTVELDKNDPLSLVLIIPQNKREPLFQLNHEEPGGEFKRILAAMGPRLVDLINSPEWYTAINSVVIEGHTDRSAAKDAPFFNMQLSQNRSRRVLEIMLDDTVARGGGTARDRFWSITSASGRADRDCDEAMLADDCRRVQFRIRVKSKEQRELAVAATGDQPASAAMSDGGAQSAGVPHEASAGI
jgi:flagellar motor protein MotB